MTASHLTHGPATGNTAPSSAPDGTWRHNQANLSRFACHRDLRRRNQLVSANLPLVTHLAQRERQRCSEPFDDLFQVGAMGLIKAIEAFDPARGAALSSFAVPYIRGAIRQYLRDRVSPLSGTRGLRDLQQQGERLLRQQPWGQPPLGDAVVSQQLGCSQERWRQARDLQAALRLTSLDRSMPTAHGDSQPLVELLASPSSTESEGYGRAIAEERRTAVRRCLASLAPEERDLLVGHGVEGLSWRQLGLRLGISGKVAKRRCLQLLDRLQQQLTATLT